MDDGEARKWDNVFDPGKRLASELLGQDSPDNVELASLKPPQSSVIGYVTSGNFSLSRGEGFIIGAIPVARLFELKDQAARLKHPSSLLVKVRDRGVDICRPAHLELLID